LLATSSRDEPERAMNQIVETRRAAPPTAAEASGGQIELTDVVNRIGPTARGALHQVLVVDTPPVGEERVAP
jgi:hypothetical protein